MSLIADLPISDEGEERVPLPDAAVPVLRQYAARVKALEAESMAYLRGLVIGLGRDPDAVANVDLSSDPALVFSAPSSDPERPPEQVQE